MFIPYKSNGFDSCLIITKKLNRIPSSCTILLVLSIIENSINSKILYVQFSKIGAFFDWVCFDYNGCKNREISEGPQKATSFLYETAFSDSGTGLPTLRKFQKNRKF